MLTTLSVAALTAALAAGAAPERAPRDRIEAIELDASGRGGSVRTSPIFMGGAETRFDFGVGACRGHKLGEPILTELHRAMRSRQSVRITADERKAKGGETVHCIKRVTFFPPEPK